MRLYFNLTLEECGRKDNFVRRYFFQSEERKQLGRKHEFGQCKRREVTKAFPAGTVDVTHHEVDIRLRKSVKCGDFLRANLTDILMVFFTVRFLPGGHWVAIINAGPQNIVNAAFKCVGMAEFSAPVGQNQGHRFTKQKSANGPVDFVKDVFNAGSFLGIQQKSHHESRSTEMQGEKYLVASLRSNDSVHFRDPGIGVLPNIGFIILVGASFKNAGIVNPGGMCLSGLVLDLFGKIKVVDRENSRVDIIVKSLLALPDFRMVLKDHVNGLPLSDEWTYRGIKQRKFVLRYIDSSSGFHKHRFVLPLGTDGAVIVFVEPASAPFWTGIAHIGSLVRFGTVVVKGDEIFAEVVASWTVTTFLVAVKHHAAHMLKMAVLGKRTSKGRLVEFIVFLKYAVLLDFLGNRSRIFAQV